jgi:hypothetical protein
MSNIQISPNIRLVPRNSDFLDRKRGSRGEIFYDQDSISLRIYDGTVVGGTELARSDLENVSDQLLISKTEQILAKKDLTNVDDIVFKNKATAAGITASTTVDNQTPLDPVEGELWFDTNTGVLYIYYNDGTSSNWVQPSAVQIGGGAGGATSNSFSTISVTGQNSLIAQTSESTLRLIEGSNISINTDATNNSITISATISGGPGGNAFGTIDVQGQGSVAADSASDALTLIAGPGITILTNPVNDSITISTVAAGSGSFSALAENTTAGLTIDRIYLPAITMFTVTNSGAVAYRFDHYGTTNNPTLYALSGATVAFNLNITGHPFLIQTNVGANYSEGLIHVTTDGVVSTGTSAQGKTSGTLYWKIPKNVTVGSSITFRYQCSVHSAMVGSIIVKNIEFI